MRWPFLCIVGFWDGDYVSQLPYVLFYVVTSSFNHVFYVPDV